MFISRLDYCDQDVIISQKISSESWNIEINESLFAENLVFIILTV